MKNNLQLPKETKQKDNSEMSATKTTSPIKAYEPPTPISRRLHEQFAKFLDIFKKLYINICFVDALA